MLKTEFFSCAGSRLESLLANPEVLAALARDGVEVMAQAAAVAAEERLLRCAMASRRETSGGLIESANATPMQ